MNRDATIEKAIGLIREAADNKAELVVFPEVFVPGYPYWARFLPPMQSLAYTKDLIMQAVQLPSSAIDKLAKVARECRIFVMMGINEKIPNAHGTLFNTNIWFDSEGRLIGRHRKLVPTLSEKLVWANGDGEGLRTHATKLGKLGSLICGENANSLARFVLIADGEQIHAGNYPSLPKREVAAGGFNLARDIEIRSAAHSFEGKVFTIASSSMIGETTVSYFSTKPILKDIIDGGSVGHTAIYGPTGTIIGGPADADQEVIIYADINLEDALLPKLRHDIGGGYNRFDVMRVLVNRSPHQSIEISSQAVPSSLQADFRSIEEDEPPI